MNKPILSATLPSDRIVSIDVLRGFAVLGILIMNIQSFSMIGAAYLNPESYGDLTGINKWIWILSHMIACEKFMSIFSMLFGAGIILLTTRLVDKGLRAGPVHYLRNFWLLIFGLVHAYLIWYGDILVAYSLCGFLVYLFRKMNPKKLVIIGSIFFFVPVLLYLMMGFTIQYWPDESVQQNMETWKPSAGLISEEIKAMQGNFSEQMSVRVKSAIFMETFLFLMSTFWRVVAMMLLGMALFKSGVLTAEKSKSFYTRMIIIGLGLGYLIVGNGILENFSANWQMEYSMFIGSQFNYFGSVAVALGYIGILMLISKMDGFTGFKKSLSAVGKMAFTNYILMSLICTFIFYGHGLGVFGEVERWGQMLIVTGVWLVILILSPVWLKYFYYGPLEWLWRILTYRKYQPMKKTAE